LFIYTKLSFKINALINKQKSRANKQKNSCLFINLRLIDVVQNSATLLSRS